MKIAYLVNQYPKVSHSFIRREILALEALGLEIIRFSIRDWAGELVDPIDRAEQEKTLVILNLGLLRLLKSFIFVIFRYPFSLVEALGLTWKIGWRSERGLFRHMIYLLEACALLDRVKNENISGIHAHFGTNSTTVAMLCGVLGNIPYSFTVHGPEEFDKVEAIALPEKIRRAAFVVAISSFGRSQLYRWCDHASWPKIQIVPCGIDGSFFAPVNPVGLNSSRLVCVGRLSEQKGQLLLIEAAHRLQKEGLDFQLVLVGDGELREAIEMSISRYDLGNKIKITGWAKEEKVREWIVSSRVLVLPSFAEGLPVVLMESLALGRPVISTFVAGIPELIESGVSGWLIPSGSIEDLVEATRKALQTPAPILEKMGTIGRETVKEKHSIDRSARTLADLFAKEYPTN